MINNDFVIYKKGEINYVLMFNIFRVGWFGCVN